MTKECPYDTVIQEDIEYVANSFVPFDRLSNKTVLVTGASGLIGTQIVLSLICRNHLFGTNIKILAMARNRKKAEEKFIGILEDENFTLLITDIREEINIIENIDYIIHCAGVTGNSKMHVDFPTNTISTAVLGTMSMLNIARQKKISGMVYLSSYEIYGTPVKEGFISEKDYGYIDIENVRSSHKESKRLSEELCVAYANEFHIPVSIGRIPISFGAGVDSTDNRFFAQFARSVIAKEDIILHTTGDTVRSHCYVRDVITALLLIMIKGEGGKAYNIANKNASKSIAEMAEMVAALDPDSPISVRYELSDNVAKFGYNQILNCVLDVSRLEGLGWKCSVELQEMYRRMINSMRQRL